MMKKFLCLTALLNLFLCGYSQCKVTFKVKDKSYFQHDSIFIVGSFCNWVPIADSHYLLKPEGKNSFSISLNFKPGTIYYKFHRGSWETVEKNITAMKCLTGSLWLQRILQFIMK